MCPNNKVPMLGLQPGLSLQNIKVLSVKLVGTTENFTFLSIIFCQIHNFNIDVIILREPTILGQTRKERESSIHEIFITVGNYSVENFLIHLFINISNLNCLKSIQQQKYVDFLTSSMLEMIISNCLRTLLQISTNRIF